MTPRVVVPVEDNAEADQLVDYLGEHFGLLAAIE